MLDCELRVYKPQDDLSLKINTKDENKIISTSSVFTFSQGILGLLRQ